LKLYISNRHALGFSGGNLLYQLLPRLTRVLFRPKNNTSNAHKHASFHYDTSNALFQAFLSSDMNYSSALWSGQADEALESAQNRKIQALIDKARIEPHHHILDIGCGWGDLAINAAKTTGCRVTGLTLAAEQKALAEQRIRAAGLESKIEILLCDYRKAPTPKGGYDRVVSVEMLEHVGEKFLKSYFATISKLLKPEGGIMVVQGITNINYVSAKKCVCDMSLTNLSDRSTRIARR
jgi:cyclopropane-fatty-acyl-phospholipid synthase